VFCREGIYGIGRQLPGSYSIYRLLVAGLYPAYIPDTILILRYFLPTVCQLGKLGSFL